MEALRAEALDEWRRTVALKFPGKGYSIHNTAVSDVVSADLTDDSTVVSTVDDVSSVISPTLQNPFAPQTLPTLRALRRPQTPPTGPTGPTLPTLPTPSEEEIERLINKRQYPGLPLDKVGLPFMLIGSINVKTGEVHIIKHHFKYVMNTIPYNGILRGFKCTNGVVAHELSASEVSAELLNKNADRPTVFSFDAISIDMRADWSCGRVALVPICLQDMLTSPDEAVPI